METLYIDENIFLNENNNKRKYKNRKFRKRKNNKIKLVKEIFVIFIIIIISFILYLILNKGKRKTIRIDFTNKKEVINDKIFSNSTERTEPYINHQINLNSNESSESIANGTKNSYSNETRESNISNHKYSIDKDLDEEYKDMQEYIDMVMNGSLYNPNEIFKESENPKISIVITVYNGEAYLKTALLSIENQDFKDIEIIMIDDCSKDDSVNLIKELMTKDPRIKLYQNEENKGMLYTKTRGILYAKGKYVLLLDEDDIYGQRDAFSTLYYEAERNNLDILGFGLLRTGIHLEKGGNIIRYIKTDIIYQPYIPNRMHQCDPYNCKRVGDLTANYFFRTDFFVDTIKQIDDKFMNVKMNFHDDFLLFFILTRKAHSLRQIKRVFYLAIEWQNTNNAKMQFRIREKQKNTENDQCLAYINYIEFVLIKTNNDTNDKRIASLELNDWFFNNQCKYNKFIREKSINVMKLFLENDFIEKEVKDKILVFLNETSQNSIEKTMNPVQY